MKIIRMAIVAAFVLFCTGISYSQIEELSEARETQANKKTQADTGKDKGSDVTFSLHGYAQGNFVVSRNDMGVTGNQWIDSRYEFPRVGATLQLELEGNAYDVAHFFTALMIEYNAAGEKTNFFNVYNPAAGQQYSIYNKQSDFKRDEISKYPTVNLRECYVDLYSKYVTFRAGQQIISWGEIEGIETPSDVVIPWDYTTMSNYFEYSRLSVGAANLSFHFAKQQLQFIWMPIFQPSKLPLDSLYNRGVTSISRPNFEVRNGEYAARLSGVIGDQFRYGLGFLYGYDDMPDTKVTMIGSYQNMGPMTIFVPDATLTNMYYNRVMIPTLDMGIGMGNVMSWKISASANFTKDFYGKSDGIKNSSVYYLTGPESTNIFAKIYLGLYLGQQWIINYTKPTEDGNMLQTIGRLNAQMIPTTTDLFEGYGQLYPYRWILSSNIQRSFLEGDALDVQVRFAVYIDPKFKYVDYIVYPYLMYKFTNGVSTAIGFIIADRMGEGRHMIISETRYSF